MEKLISVGSIIVISIAMGALIRDRMLRVLDELSALNSDLRLMRHSIKFERRSLDDVLALLIERGKLSAVWREVLDQKKGGGKLSFSSAAGKRPNSISSEGFAELDAYLNSFGNGDACSEAERLDELISRLSKIESEKTAEYQKRLKLTIPLSVMAGAAIALIVI